MLFNSWEFIVFFPITLLVYYLVPIKYRYIWLLITSYLFYMNWDLKYTLLLLFSTVITYIGGVVIDVLEKNIQEKDKKILLKKTALISCIIINLAILISYKYYNFFTSAIENVLAFFDVSIEIPNSTLLLPVGISFYIFQALGYIIDVYRKEINAEKNILRYALFVSFFPQLVAGPIERSKNLLGQLNNIKKFDYDKFVNGFLLVLWGFFIKLVIADRISGMVDIVYGDITGYSGTILFVATVLFAFQIYCDFAGYSIIAMGTAAMMGFTLMENFNAPYLAENVNEFWKRWHISLTSWFRDYLYIPLGGNRKGILSKCVNLLIVFGISGLWHGAAWTYIAWGLINGIYRVIGEVFKELRKVLRLSWNIGRSRLICKICKIIITFILVDITWIFFRAEGIVDAIYIFKKILTDWTPNIFWDGSLLRLGMDSKNVLVLLFSLFVLLLADIAKNNGIIIREIVLKQNFWFQYFFILISIVSILVFGIWGPAYDASSFIYFQF